MRLSQSRICATAILVLLVSIGSGCNLIAKIRAKNELNEAAKAYKEGHFDQAEQHAKRALALDPGNKTAPIFIARIIHQQYKPGVDSPDNVQRARDAIEAYKQILQSNPNDEEAYKSISVLYSAIKDETNLRDWIMKRATDPNQTNEKRAEAYAILAGKDWDCSFKVTEQPDVKVVSEGKANYQKPKDPKDFEKIQQCVIRGLEQAETAIKFDPNSESAWSYKTNLLIENAKIAKMNNDENAATQYERQAETAQKRATQLADERRKKEEAAAAASPTP
jgi:tetratricopeptide (TPR) repeat protein